MANRWPKDNQAALIAFYGEPGADEVSDQLVPVIPPFKFTFAGKPFPRFMVHKKIAEPFARVLDKIWDYYGHDQAKLDALHISRTAGTYNPRKIAGSNKWSNHAFGAAVDINSEENGFGTSGAKMPKPVVAAFKSEGFAWGGDYKGRTDPMHFEAVDRGEPARTFEEWLIFYKQPLPPRPTPIPVPKPTIPVAKPPLPKPPPVPRMPKPPTPPVTTKAKVQTTATVIGIAGVLGAAAAFITEYPVAVALGICAALGAGVLIYRFVRRDK